MKMIMLGLGLVTFVSGLSAQAKDRYPYSVTGEGLIGQFYGPVAMNGKQRTFEESQQYEIARAYISGVKDSNEGTAWCHLPNVKPDELDSFLISDMRKLPREELKGVAAPLLVAALNKRFPCPSGRAK